MKRARMAVLGNGLSSSTELGPLASAVQLKHVTELVEDARRKGGRVLCGGGATAGPPGDVSRSETSHFRDLTSHLRDFKEILNDFKFFSFFFLI